MNLPAKNILQHLFKVSLLADVSEEQLKQITDEHPYFGAAQFLFAKKLYHSNKTEYKKEIQKTALHFSDVLWLHFNLNEEDNTVIEQDKSLETAEIINDDHANKAEKLKEENEIINEKLSSLLQQQAAAFEQPVETDSTVAVENVPYHSIDYFDSQGIMLEEAKANDKLGTQLKKFTDWLKQMKRINSNPSNLGNDEAGEMQVKNIAEHSNESETVVTEAMADVLVKQGKPEQAINIYQKLSFNNPSKSAYFAAKIEELKG